VSNAASGMLGGAGEEHYLRWVKSLEKYTSQTVSMVR